MGEPREWFDGITSRGLSSYKYCSSKHVNLTQLKDDFPDHRYLSKRIPSYPKCVFHASKVSHVTDRAGLLGILADQGFRGTNNFLWWSLAVTESDIFNAAERDLDRFNVLKSYTTSTAFQNESLYGNFRFTFNLRHLLHIYSQEFCDGTAPILRVLETKFFKQEIVYSILVHPKHETRYNQNRRLPRSAFRLCGYKRGRVSWRCQSPSNKYHIDMGKGYEEYFVWDNVAVAFHMEPDWVLPVRHVSTLCKKLSACKHAAKYPDMPIHKAEEEVKNLKARYI